MKTNLFKFAFLFAMPITLIGCNSSPVEFSSKIAAVKTSSGVDIVIKDSVKDFKKVFKYGDLIEFTFNDGNNNNYTYTAPFVTNYTTAGMFNCSICDFEKAGSELTICLGASKAYDTIDKDKAIDNDIHFKLKKSGGWNSVYEKVPLSQKRTYKFIGRDNYVYSNSRDIKTSGLNLKNSEIGSGRIIRQSSSFDHIENAKRYDYSDGILGDIIDKNGKNRYVLLVDLYYNNFKYGTVLFKEIATKARQQSSFTELITQEDTTADPHLLSINIGDNYFSTVNKDKIANIFHKKTSDPNKGIIDILKDKVQSTEADSNYALVLNDGDGIERVGFISLLLSCLAGANYEGANKYNDLVSDYMISYKNYYNILPYDETLEQYNLIKSLTIDRLIYALWTFDNEEVFKNTDWSDVEVATKYIKDNKIDKATGEDFQNKAIKYFAWLFPDLQAAEKLDDDVINPLKNIVRGRTGL